MADMRPYAQRLAHAMPERFWLTVDEPSGNWMCSSVGSFVSNVLTNPASQWAFWGPLAVEFKIKSVWCAAPHEDLLEAIADAVCQEAERRGEEE